MLRHTLHYIHTNPLVTASGAATLPAAGALAFEAAK
jgi:hypothetical protein